MFPRFATVLILATLISATVYLWIKLEFFGLRNRRGRSAFLWGASLIAVSLVWQFMKLDSGYNDWFVPKAYVAADILQALTLIAGIILFGLGIVLHDRFWNDSRLQLEDRERKLAILENLQHDARQPYQLLELLDLTLREIANCIPGACGAVFMANRTRRQFVLTTSVGFSKEEIAALEHYPLDKNIVSQAVELGESLIAPGFDFEPKSGRGRSSRFRSALVLPLIAGGERIGGLLLCAEVERRFDSHDVRYLTPVAEWLSERIRGARLQRELSLVRSDRDRLSTQLHSLHDRVGAAVAALAAPDPLGAFCRALAGVFGCSEVHLCSIAGGKLSFLAGSTRMGEPSESYKTALIEAIDRQRPLLINQESSDEQGRDKIVASTLVSSLGGEHAAEAILFRRDSGGMSVDEPSLRTLEAIARLAGLALDFVRSERRALAQRIGLDRVVHFLSPNLTDTPITAEQFVEILAPAFPETSAFLVFSQESDSRWHVKHTLRVSERLVSGLALGSAEGGIGRAASDMACTVITGREEVGRAIDEYQPLNRQTFGRLLGPELGRAYFAICPLRIANSTQIVVVLSNDFADHDPEEYRRLLTLASGLCSFRAAIESRRSDLEHAGQTPSTTTSKSTDVTAAGTEVATAVSSVLAPLRISGDLYMVGGRPREIHSHVQPVASVAASSTSLRQTFEQLVVRFATLAADDEVITLSIYQDDQYVYLDASRHRRFFSPVTSVAQFGQYRNVLDDQGSQASGFLPPGISITGTSMAIDSASASPTYLSIRLPRRFATAADSSGSLAAGGSCVLVIDDQSVILDLVSAMCQTIGYRADLARSGEIGLRLASERDYALVLVDLAMPGLSGLEVARELKRRKPGIPVVIMTGWEASLDRAALNASGVVDILYKPFRIEQLSELLRTAVKTG